MNNRLDAYMDDLEGRLGRHFDSPRLNEVLAEMRSHVTYSARDAVDELGLEPDEAVRAALVALGPVETVAEDLVAQHRGGSSKSPWHLLRFPLVLYAACALVLPSLYLLIGTHPSSPIFPLMQLIPMLVLAGFAFAVWRSRRWLTLPMIGGMVPCYALAIGMWSLPGYSQWMAAKAGMQPDFREDRIAQIDRELKMVDLGSKGYLETPHLFLREGSLSNYLYPLESTNTLYVQLGFLPITIPIYSVPTYYLNADIWRAQRADDWSRYGAAMRETLLKEREELMGGGGKPLTGWILSASNFGSQAAMLAATNLAVLAASNRRRRRRAHRDPHLA